MYFDLTDKIKIPAIGFGTWQLRGGVCERAVGVALETGYRLIDTAEFYGNHREIAAAIKLYGVERGELFITTKVPPFRLRRNSVISAVKKYCEELSTDYLDLILVHWPNPLVPSTEPLEAFEELLREGVVRSYGVSNYGIRRLSRALDAGYKVVNDQVQYNPTHNPKDLREFCQKHGVVVTAYSPIGQGRDLNLPLIRELSRKYGKSAAQVILNWEIQKGLVVVPRSANSEHIKDNFGAWQWKMEPGDIEKIDNLT